MLFDDAETCLHPYVGKIKAVTPVAGGSINHSACVKGSEATAFVKWNADAPPGFFAAEVDGLRRLGQAGASVPSVMGHGQTQTCTFLVMEYIRPATRPVDRRTLGQRLAECVFALHQTRSSAYGLSSDNFIGTLPQSNTQTTRWADFYKEERLRPLLKAANLRPPLTRRINRLIEQLDELVGAPAPPSLLHGDLWSGNYLVAEDGTPYLVDPAVYFGVPEVELAFSELFGGFPASFYEHYWRLHPRPANYETLRSLYQIYPLLVHVILFGGGYAKSLRNTVDNINVQCPDHRI